MDEGWLPGRNSPPNVPCPPRSRGKLGPKRLLDKGMDDADGSTSPRCSPFSGRAIIFFISGQVSPSVWPVATSASTSSSLATICSGVKRFQFSL